MNLKMPLAIALAFSFGIVPDTFGADPTSPQERLRQQMGQEGNAMGVPEPGTVSDIEKTKKQPNPAQMNPPEETRQITVGGGQYFVEGEVLKIDGERFTIKKDDSGEQVRLIVNRDTNLDCADAPPRDGKRGETMTTERVPLEKQGPAASERQIEQGQRKDETALGSGFRIGSCNWQPGDRVKVEVDDMGRATTLKYLAGIPASSPRSSGESAGTGELAIPGKQDKPGRLDITGGKGFPPEEYAVVPVRRGELKSVGNQALQKPLQNLKGERVGHIDNLLLDAKTGRIEYAVIELEDTYYLKPVPYAAIQLKQKGDEIVPIIDTTKYDLSPVLSMKDTKDLSPAVTDIVKQMQTLREREPRKAGQREGAGVKEPPIGGPMGETEAGGGGLSGPRGLPPGNAPGFEQEKKKHD